MASARTRPRTMEPCVRARRSIRQRREAPVPAARVTHRRRPRTTGAPGGTEPGRVPAGAALACAVPVVHHQPRDILPFRVCVATFAILPPVRRQSGSCNAVLKTGPRDASELLAFSASMAGVYREMLRRGGVECVELMGPQRRGHSGHGQLVPKCCT